MFSVRLIDENNRADINIPNEPFTSDGRMIPSYTDRKWGYTVEHTDGESQTCFPDENYDYDKMKSDCIFIGAYDNEKCIGLAIYQKGMYDYMYLYDLKVNKAYRKQGIGSMLIEAGKRTAVSNGRRGIYTIGQDYNLGACLFYIRTGFRIGGLDTDCYNGTGQNGVADIYFYLDC